MKTNRFYSMVATGMVVLSALVMSSCTVDFFTEYDDDTMIGGTLQGTWVGNMYVVNEWNGNIYKTTESEVTFNGNPYHGDRSGSGYWVDYYSGYGWDYVANRIRWEVIDGYLYIYFLDDGGQLVLGDYSVGGNRFEGYIYDDYKKTIFFSLRRTYNSYYDSWDAYNYGWGYWNNYGPSYAKSTKAKAKADDFNMTENVGKPVRHIINGSAE